ncbi:GGDEF domain-containing protein [Christensenellaceae bacterium OttesenSCG-928-K19]|nr:GGDEF domain-containing protein [Christensenellaceae bacterium OttesenSCG-928-K19]
MDQNEKTTQANGIQNFLGKVFRGVPADQRDAFKAQRLETNVGRSYGLSIYLIVIQILLNVINIVKPSDSKSSDIMIYIVLSMGLLVVGIVYFILLTLVRKKKIKSHGVKLFLVESLLYVYLVVQMIFCTLNIISTGGVNSYIIAILILGMVPIISPLQSIVSILGSFAYLFIAMYVTRNISGAWNSILITDTWANLLIITGLTICVSVFMHNMYVSNFLQRVSLRNSNRELLNLNQELAQMNDKLENIANTDKMTGVLNRRAFSNDFDEIWDSSIMRKTEIAVAIVDIDFFKAYNDKFGHLEGDKCLQLIAASLKNSFKRGGDVVYRYGGEEFLIVFESGRDEAFKLVERARINVEELKIPHAKTIVSPYVTISAGVCVITPSRDISEDDALKIADDALYESKHNGRNRTTLKVFEDNR